MNQIPTAPMMNPTALPPDPRWEGIKLGIVTAFSLCLLYALTAAPIGYIGLMAYDQTLFPTFSLRDSLLPLLTHIATIYIFAVAMSGAAFVAGVIPALFFGAIGGGVIGGVLRTFVRHTLPRRALWRLALQTSLLLAMGALLLTGQFTFNGTQFDALLTPLITIGPSVVVFFAFIWITFRLHRLLPPATIGGADG